MKILVYLNHGIDKSYLLHFGNRVRKEDIEKVVRLGKDTAASAIYGYASLYASVRKIEVPEEDRVQASLAADFVVGAPV